MAPRQVYFHESILAALPRRQPQRRAVLNFLAELGEKSHLGGDFQEYDEEEQRDVEVTVIGGLSFSWWIDDPVNQVKIVQVRPADRSK